MNHVCFRALAIALGSSFLLTLSACCATCCTDDPSCAEGDACCAEGAASGSETIAYRELLCSPRSGLTRHETRVIEDADEFAQVWKACAGDALPSRSMPEVDWATERVLCVAAGERPTTGHEVRIESIVRNTASDGSEVTTVVYRESAPRADAQVGQVMTSPVHLVVIPRSTGTVEFVASTEK